MKPHVKIYMNYFGYTEADFIPCEVCEGRAVDIHHVDARGMGGDPNGKKDVIENLMGLCRKCHEAYGDYPQFKQHLSDIHKFHMAHKKGRLVITKGTNRGYKQP